jgi:outer membrane protein assembly factor BamB
MIRHAVFVWALVAAAAACADDWPGWRGPHRDGTSDESHVPLDWSAESGVRWKVPLPGSGISSPIVWRNQVFVTSSSGPRQEELHVICLAADDGRELLHETFWGTAPTLYHATKSSMASPSPVTDGRSLYAFFGTGDVFCLDLEGRLVWSRSLATEYGEFENRFAASSSPLLYGDRLLVQCDHYGASYLVAIDAATGANRWKRDRPEAWLSWSSPQLAPLPEGGCELVVCGSEKIDAFDPESGETLWTLFGLCRECVPTPVLGHGLIYAASGPGGATLAVRPGGRGDVTDTHLVWQNERAAPFVPSGIVVGDLYFVADDKGLGACLDAHTGEVVWRHRLEGAFTASPVAAAGRVYFVNEEGVTFVLDASSRQYRELARNELGEAAYASPAIAAGALFVRTAGHLFCIEE